MKKSNWLWTVTFDEEDEEFDNPKKAKAFLREQISLWKEKKPFITKEKLRDVM